jgi:6-hydroxytryprostatin B O-methyltransferase
VLLIFLFKIAITIAHDLKFQYISCLSWLCQYDIFHLVPLNGNIGYETLAATAGVPKQRLKSVMRMAMTNTLFRETADGESVVHSATSALLARNNDVYAYATHMCSQSAPMAMHMTSAAQRWGPGSMKTYETAYNDAFATDLPFFDHLGRDPGRMAEFAAYMRNVRSSEGVNIKHLVGGYAWQDIKNDGVVVDVSKPLIFQP